MVHEDEIFIMMRLFDIAITFDYTIPIWFSPPVVFPYGIVSPICYFVLLCFRDPTRALFLYPRLVVSLMCLKNEA